MYDPQKLPLGRGELRECLRDPFDKQFIKAFKDICEGLDDQRTHNEDKNPPLWNKAADKLGPHVERVMNGWAGGKYLPPQTDRARIVAQVMEFLKDMKIPELEPARIRNRRLAANEETLPAFGSPMSLPGVHPANRTDPFNNIPVTVTDDTPLTPSASQDEALRKTLSQLNRSAIFTALCTCQFASNEIPEHWARVMMNLLEVTPEVLARHCIVPTGFLMDDLLMWTQLARHDAWLTIPATTEDWPAKKSWPSWKMQVRIAGQFLALYLRFELDLPMTNYTDFVRRMQIAQHLLGPAGTEALLTRMCELQGPDGNLYTVTMAKFQDWLRGLEMPSAYVMRDIHEELRTILKARFALAQWG